MNRKDNITGNASVDLVVAQVLSLLYLSNVSVRLVKWQSSENPYVSAMRVPPPVALFDKAVYTSKGLKKLSESVPSWKATSGCIRVLSKLALVLGETDLRKMPKAFVDDIKAIAALQLQYCLDFMPKCIPGKNDIAAVLEAGSEHLRIYENEPADIVSSTESGLQSLYERLIYNLSIQSKSTMELAYISKGIAAWKLYMQKTDKDFTLSEIVLEIISRKSKSGLFSHHVYSTASVALGQQFFILDSIIASYPFVMLEVVRDRVYDVIKRLLDIAYKDPPGMFSFWRNKTVFSAFDAGAIISCLDRMLSCFACSFKKEVLSEIRHSAVNLLINPIVYKYNNSMLKAFKWYCIMHNTANANIGFWTDICPILPKRVLVNPDFTLRLSSTGVIKLADLMYLCSSLLNV